MEETAMAKAADIMAMDAEDGDVIFCYRALLA